MRKNILITGASSGLGEEMARQFAAAGHNLALCARRTDRLAALAAELSGVEVRTYALDVNDHPQVFAVFEQAAADLGHLDRVIVNAGLGKGGRIGTGRFEGNRQTAETNFIGALAQCEAAMEHFYARKSGHLVLVSSISAMRGAPGVLTTYGATKAGLAYLAEGIRMDLVGRGLQIKVTTLFPGFIASELTGRLERSTPLMVDTETGVRAMVVAIQKEVDQASVPRWPWLPVGVAMKYLPRPLARRMF